ncbi:MAG TPA: hypothetical protein VFY12_13250 [Arenimonas sp.]|nr:hypothetical protein [Arenimonas sp.]
MNRLPLRLASLLVLLLAGCASYGPYYGEQRAVYRDGDYYVAADNQYGDYYYGAPEVEYRYLDSWSSYGFWRMDRYRCGFYGDCWRYRGYSHWSPFAPSWNNWYGGWSFSIAPSWYYGRWGWHDRHHHHDRRDRPRRDRARTYDAPPPVAPRNTEPAPTRPLPRRPLPMRYDGEYRREPRAPYAERLPPVREAPPSRPPPRPLMPEAGYARPRQPERATLPVQPRARVDAQAPPRQWQRPSPPPMQPPSAPPPSQPMPRRETDSERAERSPRSRDGIEP